MGLSTSGPTSKKGPVRKAFINILTAWSNQGEADEYKTKTYDDACFKYTCAIRYVQNQFQIIANAVAASWSSLSTLNLPWRGFANYERLSAIGSIWIDKPRLVWSIRLKNTPLNTRVSREGGWGQRRDTHRSRAFISGVFWIMTRSLVSAIGKP